MNKADELGAPTSKEDEWLQALQHIPKWQPPYKPTIVIAPHPDDETLGAGGLIAAQCRRGLSVSVIAATDGEAAYNDVPNLAEVRRGEQEEALRILGVSKQHITRLSLADSKVELQESELCDFLAELISPDVLVVAPWIHDRHPDHEACGRAAAKMPQNSGAEIVFYLFWTWHESNPDVISSDCWRQFDLDSFLVSAKLSALSCHRSQLEHKSGTPVLPEPLLAPARRTFETFIVQA